jgi:ribosomal protein L37AE/L43A
MPRPRNEQQQRRWADQQKRAEERLRVGSAVEWEIDRPAGVRNGETIKIPGPLAQAEELGFLPEPGSIILTGANGAAYRQQPRSIEREAPVTQRTVPVCPLCRVECRLGQATLAWNCPSCLFELSESYLARVRGTFRRPTREARTLGEAAISGASQADLLQALDAAGREIDRLQDEKKALIFANTRLLREATKLTVTAPDLAHVKRRIQLEEELPDATT